jgi:hypothetical protein
MYFASVYILFLIDKMSSVKFQYFSDVHLEFYNENINKVKRLYDIKSSPADVLLLAGDIGKPNMTTYSYFLNQNALTNS